MPLRFCKPCTPGMRFRTLLSFAELTKKPGPKNLHLGKKRFSGRSSRGRIYLTGHGGSKKKHYRLLDYKRNIILPNLLHNSYGSFGATVESLHYDPNRNAHLALVKYLHGPRKYILCPRALRIGMKIATSDKTNRWGRWWKGTVGDASPLERLPVGSIIHNLETSPRKGGKLVKAAGTSAILLAKEKKMATVRLPSGETRLFSIRCQATIGQVGNIDYSNILYGKAGRNRWLGRRPKVRGSAKNPNDHPHGGGEGKASIGKISPVTPWGKPTQGVKTRRKSR